MNNTTAVTTDVRPTQDQLDELNTLAHTGPRPHSASEAAALIRHLIDQITPPTDHPALAGGDKKALHQVNY